jgi:hypothetical protein
MKRTRAPNAIAAVGDDFFSLPDWELCCELDMRISVAYGDEIDVSKLTETERTVICVWAATGYIGNGGFRYLFECLFEGDADFELTYEAFVRIKSDAAVAAFRQAFDRFPNGKAPPDPDERLGLYLKGVRRRDLSPHEDDLFYEADIDEDLARYIRDHRAAFATYAASPRPSE